VMRTALIMVVRGYQVAIGPLLPPACRYYPSCSNYAIEAIEKYPPGRSGWQRPIRRTAIHPPRQAPYFSIASIA